MAILDKISKVVDGDQLDDDFFNGVINESLKIGGLNLIRQMQKGTVDFSAEGADWYGDAYTELSGNNGSVNDDSTAFYNVSTNSYESKINIASSGTTHDPNGFTNPDRAFNYDSDYAQEYVDNDSNISKSIGKTFSAKTIQEVYVNTTYGINPGTAGTYTIKLQSYNGSVWSDVSTLDSGNVNLAYDGVYDTSSLGSIQGLRVLFTAVGGAAGDDHTCRVYNFMYWENEGDAIVSHDIPSDQRFSSAMSSAFLTCLVHNWGAGAGTQYKLINATEDTGWLNYNEISSFTAFTSEPLQYIVKLEGTISIKGSAIRGS